MDIYYQSASNRIIDFKSSTYRLQTADIFDYEWDFESIQSVYGGTITRFTKKMAKKDLKFTVKAPTKQGYYDALNDLLEITEKDIVENTPGRLYVNGYYLTCYVVAGSKSEWESGAPICDGEVQIIAPNPFFTREDMTSYSEQTITGDYGKYPMRYPTRYASGATSQELINPHFSNSPFKMVIYGACTNPAVMISGNLYQVNVVLLDGELLIINTQERTIAVQSVDGTVTNAFNLQNRNSYIFESLSAGSNTISWDGTFAIDITIFEQRSEPKWQDYSRVSTTPITFGLEVDMENNTFTRIADAYGLSAGESFNALKCYSGRRRCMVTDGGIVLKYFGEDGYTETGLTTKVLYKGVMQFPIGTPVQVMVEQPKFYYKVTPLKLDAIVGGKGFHLRKARYYVSDYEIAGYKLHPTFLINGQIKDFIYPSAFEGSIYDTSANAYLLADEQVADFNADKMCSIANAKPMSGLTQLLTRANARKLANNRGSGWQQQFAHTISASQLLFMIEYASFNSQTAIGLGVVSKASGTGNESENTGATSSLGNASGMASGTNGLVSVTYRGEENLWGNIWKFIDGINIYGYSQNLAYISNYGLADNIGTAPYTDVGFTLAKTNGYISAFGYSTDCDFMFLPSETLGTSSLPVGDFFYQSNVSNSWLIARLGGTWATSDASGGFCWIVNTDSSYRSLNVGARLVFIP